MKIEVTDNLLVVLLEIDQVRAYAARPDNSNLAKACRKALEDLEEIETSSLVNQLRERACPAGEPWTGDYPEEDHGHTDCYLHNKSAREIERLQSEVFKAEKDRQKLNSLLKLVNEWVDVQPGRTKADMDRRISVAYDLRKAVGR